MTAKETKDSHRPPTDGGMAKEEFIRVGTTLYKLDTTAGLRQTLSSHRAEV